MSFATIDDRASLERIYPREAFEQDSRENARADVAVVQGVRILSEPDGAGAFAVARARQHAGERDPEGDTVFLAPSLTDQPGALAGSDAYGGGEEGGPAPAPEQDAYGDFLAKIFQAARTAEFKRPIGRGEERLRGFHGG